MKSLIDSNILIYAYNQISPFHKEASQFLESRLKKGEVVFSIQNLYEAYTVFTGQLDNPLSPKQAIEIIRYYYINPKVTILYPSRLSAMVSLDLLQKRKVAGNLAFDMVIVGQMIENKIKVIYTKNVRDFSGIREIKVIDPLK